MTRGGFLVQILAERVLQPRHLVDAVELGHADPFAELADRLGRVTAAANADDRRHARVVPAADVLFGHQLDQPPFAQDGVRQVEPGKLDLLRDGRCRAGRCTSRTAVDGSRIPACRSSA